MNLALQLGMALMENGKYQEAIDELAVVLKERKVPMAVDMSSICHFKLGNREEGWRLAKRANQLGKSVAYEMAVNGEFRPQAPGR